MNVVTVVGYMGTAYLISSWGRSVQRLELRSCQQAFPRCSCITFARLCRRAVLFGASRSLKHKKTKETKETKSARNALRHSIYLNISTLLQCIVPAVSVAAWQTNLPETRQTTWLPERLLVSVPFGNGLTGVMFRLTEKNTKKLSPS